jgi:hypothetical protein
MVRTNTRVVDQDIDPAEAIYCGLNCCFADIAGGDVACDRDKDAWGQLASQFFAKRLQAFLGPRDTNDIHAMLCERLRHHSPKACAGAGDHCNSAG